MRIDVVGIFYCATEILSILENASNAGLPIPNKLKSVLEQCQDNKNNQGYIYTRHYRNYSIQC